jgi:hypothetical protein
MTDTRAGGVVPASSPIRTISSVENGRSFHVYERGGHVDYTQQQVRCRGRFQTRQQRQNAASTNACERSTSYLPRKECYEQLDDYCRSHLPPTPDVFGRMCALDGASTGKVYTAETLSASLPSAETGSWT